jgi:methylglutaconyl-CoA hydratase
MMKEMFWKGTEHWDHLLPERAAVSGRLVLSPFTRHAIQKFRKK